MAKIWKTYTTAYYDSHPTPAGEFVKPQKATAEELAALKAKNDKLFNGNPASTTANAAKKPDDGGPVEASSNSGEKVSTGPNGGSLVPEVSADPTPVQATSEPQKGLLAEPQTAMPAPAPDFHHDAAAPGAAGTPDPVPAPSRGATIDDEPRTGDSRPDPLQLQLRLMPNRTAEDCTRIHRPLLSSRHPRPQPVPLRQRDRNKASDSGPPVSSFAWAQKDISQRK